MAYVELVDLGKVRYVTEEIPDIRALFEDFWVEVRMEAVGLCGSDIHKLLHQIPDPGYLQTRILGHEIAGTVLATGPGVHNLTRGDRVAVNPIISCGHCSRCLNGNTQYCERVLVLGRNIAGGFADRIYAPAGNCYRVSGSIDYVTASLTDVAASSCHCVHQLGQLNAGNRVAIIGDGPIALLASQYMLYRGVREVAILGKHPHNCGIAEKLGVEVIAPEQMGPVENSFDKVIEAVGGRQSETLDLAIKLAAVKGRIAVAGVYDSGYVNQHSLRNAFYKEIEICGANSFVCNGEEDEFRLALELLENRKLVTEPLVSHVLELKDFGQALTLIRNKGREHVTKIVFVRNA